MANSKIVMGIDDVPMWRSIERGRMELQCCKACAAFRYPPAPVCPQCLETEAAWTPIAGRGRIMSWVVFHRQYFDDHVPPYNSVAVQLPEGPIVVSQLMGTEPEGSWIGHAVEFCYAQHAGRMQHHVRLVSSLVQGGTHDKAPA
jgi:uncharacterized OB-fold protein